MRLPDDATSGETSKETVGAAFRTVHENVETSEGMPAAARAPCTHANTTTDTTATASTSASPVTQPTRKVAEWAKRPHSHREKRERVLRWRRRHVGNPSPGTRARESWGTTESACKLPPRLTECTLMVYAAAGSPASTSDTSASFVGVTASKPV